MCPLELGIFSDRFLLRIQFIELVIAQLVIFVLAFIMRRIFKFSLFSFLYILFLLKADLYCANTNGVEKIAAPISCISDCCDDKCQNTCTAPCCEIAHSHSPQTINSSSRFELSQERINTKAFALKGSNYIRTIVFRVKSHRTSSPYRSKYAHPDVIDYQSQFCIWRC